MVNQQLLDYIKQQTQIGKNREEITAALLAAGWQAQDVEQAFINPTPTNTGVPMPIISDLPKARQILSESWAIYKNRFKTLIVISLIPLLCYAIVGFIAGGGFVALQRFFNIGGVALPLLIIIAVIAVIFFIYLGIWGAVAGLFAIKDAGESIGWKEAYKRSRPKIGPFFFTSILSGLAIMGGFILLIVPGIIFGLWFSQSPYIVIEEGLVNTAALKRSKYYIKGRIGQVFGKLFYIGIITFALSVGLSIILAIIAALSHIKYEDISWIANIFSLIWAPLVTVYGYQLYKYCKATRP